MLNVEHVATQGLARLAAGEPARMHSGHEPTQERGDRQVVRDAANQQHRGEGKHALLGVRRRPSEEEPCRPRQQHGDDGGLPDEREGGKRCSL